MITRLILALCAVFAGWIALLAVVMVVSDDAPAALVLFPAADLIDRLPAGVAITARTGLSVTLAADTPGLAAALYRAGAVLVLPAGLLGCAPLTS